MCPFWDAITWDFTRCCWVQASPAATEVKRLFLFGWVHSSDKMQETVVTGGETCYDFLGLLGHEYRTVFDEVLSCIASKAEYPFLSPHKRWKNKQKPLGLMPVLWLGQAKDSTRLVGQGEEKPLPLEWRGSVALEETPGKAAYRRRTELLKGYEIASVNTTDNWELHTGMLILNNSEGHLWSQEGHKQAEHRSLLQDGLHTTS